MARPEPTPLPTIVDGPPPQVCVCPVCAMRFQRQQPKIAMVIDAVAEAFDIKPSLITGRCRMAPIARVRFVAYYLARETGASLPKIGRMFGGRDHTSVLHGLRRAGAMIAEDPELRATVETLEELLFGDGEP